MAINKSITSYGNVKFLRLKSKGGVRIAQEEKDKNTGEKREILTTSIVNGALSKVELDNYEFEGEKKYNLKFTLVDGQDKFILQIPIATGLGRNIVSSFLNVKELGKLCEVSVFKNKAGYDGISLYYNGSRVEWKYDLTKANKDNMPEVEVVKVKGKKDTYNFYERDNFLLELLQKHIDSLKEPDELEDMPDLSEVKDQKETVDDISVEDVPF